MLLWQLLTVVAVQADDDGQRVKVADPFIEIHTGPGRGYPVFYVVDRGEWISILTRKTQWFKVRTGDAREGWVHLQQLEKTLTPSGEQKQFRRIRAEDYARRRWETGFLAGDLEGASQVSIYAGYTFTPNISAEFAVSQADGNFSTNWLATGSVIGHPFPQWNVSPFVALGYGMIKTDPRVTLVEASDRSDAVVHAGFGVRSYLTRQFFLRLEYHNYVVFSSNDDNEELDEWKAGIGFFF